MALYSFIVIAQQPSGIVDPMVMLDKGLNVFTAEVPDLDSFLAQLKEEGVAIKEMNRLDDFEASDSSDLQLPGEDLFALSEGDDGEV